MSKERDKNGLLRSNVKRYKYWEEVKLGSIYSYGVRQPYNLQNTQKQDIPLYSGIDFAALQETFCKIQGFYKAVVF